jgi:hypothetical protein
MEDLFGENENPISSTLPVMHRQSEDFVEYQELVHCSSTNSGKCV